MLSKAWSQSEHQLENLSSQILVEQRLQNRYDVDMTAGRESGRAGERGQVWVVVVVVVVQTKSQTMGPSNKPDSLGLEPRQAHQLESQFSFSNHDRRCQHGSCPCVHSFPEHGPRSIPRPAQVLMALPSSYQWRRDKTNRSSEDTKIPLTPHWQSFIEYRVKEWSVITQTSSILRCARSIHSRHSR